MSTSIEKIQENIDSIALEIVMMDGEDIPAMGRIFNQLCEIEKDFAGLGEAPREPADQAFEHLTAGLKIYLEKVVLRETRDIAPFEQGIKKLQSIFRCILNQKDFKENIEDLLDMLGFEQQKPVQNSQVCEETKAEIIPESEKNNQEAGKENFDVPVDIDEDDIELLAGFVSESLDSLDAIEVGLMDLEQDPEDTESINSIFRSFHTIKGISGFLNLMRINKLAHKAENLLDRVRAGEISADREIIDIILGAGDLLKKLIKGVQSGLKDGSSIDIGLDIQPMVKRIEEVELQVAEYGNKPIGQILVEKGQLSSDELEQGLEKQSKEPGKKIGQILVEENKVEANQVVSALREQKKFSSRQVALQVKVETKKLDNLIDLTGELVIAQSMLRQNQVILLAGDQQLAHNLGQLTQITTGLQTTAMSMRMVPIKSTFHKMFRLVRDLAKNSGKQVQLNMHGEDTEIDRNVVDELYEPMVHMIRNSVDHGIESPDEREKAGKSKTGQINLTAYHQGGKIIVEIEDDGRGLNKSKIVEKAKSKNLIPTDECDLTENEIYNLIFQPGFSTASKITDISGRGVGMDVVKKAIEKLRGRVEIKTQEGLGSTFIISLPLTLAIIEGMMVRVGTERYVIPALAILESFRPSRRQCSTVEGKGEVILSRNKLLPLVRLSTIFDICCDAQHPWQGLVVVVEHDGHQMGLLLDELLGKEEVVIKSLGESLKNVRGIAGGAILGDGRVGLILDMAGIWEIVKDS